jgi:predicted ABC-type ATPase
MPKLYIIAGPNGAGKTTFAKVFLPLHAKCSNFVNADLIAMGLAPFSPAQVSIKAGKLLLGEIDSFIGKKADFAFETTLAGKAYVNLIKEAKSKGYFVHIIFLWIPSENLAKERIKQRVKQGGHHVPDADVERRLGRSLKNFFDLYSSLADAWDIVNNSGPQPEWIVNFNAKGTRITNKALYECLLKEKSI